MGIMDDDAIRTRLRAALAKRGVSARQVSLRAGLSPNVVSGYLRSNSATLQHSTLVAIAAALEVDISDLISDPATENAPDYSVSARGDDVDEDVMWAVLRALEGNQRRIVAAQERLTETQERIAEDIRAIRDALTLGTKKR